uniref:Uncharacterized protein n=1 Tax=Panagrolaimus sp. PS1159 TaxID=55785 RepID=A0AC35FGX1_9BILA
MNYNLLPAPYLLELNNVLKNVATTPDAEKRRSEFNKYSKTFTALPHFWYNWLMYERRDKNIIGEDAKFIKILRKIALSNFFNEEFLTEMIVEYDGTMIDRYPDNDRAYQKVFSLPYFREDCYKNVINRKKYLELLGSYLTFPHEHIEAVFDLYKEYSDTFIPIEVKELYEKNLSF